MQANQPPANYPMPRNFCPNKWIFFDRTGVIQPVFHQNMESEQSVGREAEVSAWNWLLRNQLRWWKLINIYQRYLQIHSSWPLLSQITWGWWGGDWCNAMLYVTCTPLQCVMKTCYFCEPIIVTLLLFLLLRCISFSANTSKLYNLLFKCLCLMPTVQSGKFSDCLMSMLVSSGEKVVPSLVDFFPLYFFILGLPSMI